MSIEAVRNTFANYAQQVTGGSSTQLTTKPSSAVEEASETTAQTVQEARNGDPVAKLKLKKLEQQQAQNQQTSSTATPTSSGNSRGIDRQA
jgi:hypothetical protein